MLLCGGDQLLFGLYSMAIVCLLIGGCLWGQGQDKNDSNKFTGGIVVFIIGGSIAVIAVIVNVIKSWRKMRKRRKVLRMSKENPVVFNKEQLKNPNIQNIQNHADLLSPGMIFIENKNNNGTKIPTDSSKTQISHSTTLNSPNIYSNNSTRPIINRPPPNSKYIPTNNGRPPRYYSNPVFTPDIVPPYPRTISPYSSHNNAAKNYSKSLYNAHINGRL